MAPTAKPHHDRRVTINFPPRAPQPAEQVKIGLPPISSFEGPVNLLLARGIFHPPPRLGLLAEMGAYEVRRTLGVGAMGVVFLVQSRTQATALALKVLRPELASNIECVRRFSGEARHLKRLSHPLIIPVLEVLEQAHVPFFTMPYQERGSLAQLIEPGRPLRPESALQWASEVAEALHYAHQLGVLHRDIKPSNVLINAQGQALLADFGLARVAQREGAGAPKRAYREGTAPYMSPALASGEPEEEPGDIYAFGALLYEMLTGTPPYQGRSTAAILKQITAGPPVPIRAQNAQAPSALVRIAESAMARCPSERYSSMGQIKQDLQKLGSGRNPHSPQTVRSQRPH